MTPFAYQRVESVDELLDRLAEDPEGSRILAGGTDLIVFMTDGKLAPRTLVDPKAIAELNGIHVNGGVRLGALTTMREIERHPELRRRYTALAAGAHEVGSVQIRCRATIGGNIGTASPAADAIPGLLVHGAIAHLASREGTRQVPVAELFVGPGRTNIQPDEALTSLQLPAVPPRTGSWYIKLATRKAMDIAFVGVAARVTLNEDGTVAEAAVALGAVAPTPMLARAAGELLAGSPVTDEALAAAAEAAQQAASPISDRRASAAYRRAMVGVLTRRALAQAAARARGDE